MYYVYILRSKKSSHYYAGYTNDMERQFAEHNNGRTKSLAQHVPLEIIRVEEYSTYREARARERQIKRYKLGRAFRKLIGR